jgi:pimeloyl-ACP methyl ester carboxylesterase
MMAPPQAMPDLIVVIPGITGSVLERNGKEVWGLSGEAIARNLLSLGHNFKHLAVPQGIGDQEPNDGVTATRLMPDLHMLPGLWTIDGYGKLVNYLKSRFVLNEATGDRVGNLLPFPYDWRLSNVISAHKLAEVALRELHRWRVHTRNPDAKLVLICHSMGGLIARWFLEVMGGRELTRRLITIGTPYQGSVNALSNLASGFSMGLGPLSVELTALVRSFPSLYQLLPTYPCLDLGGDILQPLTDVEIPGVEADRVKAAAAFHSTIAEQVAKCRAGYDIIAIKGHVQPTAQSALFRDGRIEPVNAHKGVDYGGDGTVPRPSSHPPEWDDDSRAIFAAQTHASLQNTEGVLHQLLGALTGHLGRWMGGDRIGVDVPSLAIAGEPFTVRAVADGDDPTLALRAVVIREDGAIIGEPRLLDSEGTGSYRTEFSDLPPGPYRIRVESAVLERPVDPVTDVTLVWDSAAGS